MLEQASCFSRERVQVGDKLRDDRPLRTRKSDPALLLQEASERAARPSQTRSDPVLPPSLHLASDKLSNARLDDLLSSSDEPSNSEGHVIWGDLRRPALVEAGVGAADRSARSLARLPLPRQLGLAWQAWTRKLRQMRSRKRPTRR